MTLIIDSDKSHGTSIIIDNNRLTTLSYTYYTRVINYIIHVGLHGRKLTDTDEYRACFWMRLDEVTY